MFDLNNLPHVYVKKTAPRRWGVFVDDNLHIEGYVDAVAARNAATTIRAELACNAATLRLNAQLIVKVVMQ